MSAVVPPSSLTTVVTPTITIVPAPPVLSIVPEIDQIRTIILIWIRFANTTKPESIIMNAFMTYDDIQALITKYISELAEWIVWKTYRQQKTY